ncbi:conserved exported protein of unknown function [Nitrospira sp. KM1]|uniref:caspase family protein n=1 Tax=Nitrospira sp. KM1 TaxID=1936990 RepID=UPI0013A75045|nr:hypothetical protein [Nitrospira sp. KM1]BCA54397.1 conserved exported protein of unknown function [Nitrospira sp. KM1]
MNAWRLTLILGGFVWYGCASQVELPNLGPRLSQTASLELSKSLTEATVEYADNCGHLQIFDIGTPLEDALVETANRTFKTVVLPGSSAKPDVMVHVKLVQNSFVLRMDGLYDRAPTELQLGGLVSYTDQAGNLIGEQDIQVMWKDRVRIEPMQKNCDYVLAPFVRNAAREFALRFSEGARSKLDSGRAPIAPGQLETVKPTAATAAATGAVAATGLAATSASAISFKATLLDENSNLILEGGERIRVRVDVVNTGDQELQRAAATISGTPSLTAQFPATTLSVGRLQPGQSRSLEFAATLPQSVQPQKGEIHVTVADPAVPSPPSQLLSLTIQPTGMKTDDVDHVPAAADGFRRPQTYLLSIGVGSYRDQQLSTRKYGASDAEMVATYFQSLGGIPASNVRLLQDWKALRPDIDEALLDWLPGRVTKDSVVLIYFAGSAAVGPSGDVFLIPYDGSLSTTSRAYPLKDLEAALGRLKAKQTILFFDGTVFRFGSETKGKPAAPLWHPPGSGTTKVIAINGLGRALEDEKHRHGLFTYYLLRALRGDSDTNRDAEVTLGETIAYVSQKVLWASKTQYSQEQRPITTPPMKPTDTAGALILSRLAAIKSVETP